MPRITLTAVIGVLLLLAGCGRPEAPAEQYDVVLRGGTIYDGSGGKPYIGDLAIRGERIAAVGDIGDARAKGEIDARGMAVSPGFINMLSHGNETMLIDGRAQSDIRQGVTLEIMGEGFSWGPLNSLMKADLAAAQTDFKYDVTWTTLGEYLDRLVAGGVSTNVASFIGAHNPRIHVVGKEDRAPSAAELVEMQDIVRNAMKEGALGVASSLIYPPGFYAETDELIALAEVAAEYGGIYATHMRSEGNSLLEALDEAITIAREASIATEIYHFKQAGQPNWRKASAAIVKVEAARAEGLRITADMYTYPAGSTGIAAALPPWSQEGGQEAFVARLKDPHVRATILEEMRTPTKEWEQMLALSGADNVILVEFKNAALKPLAGKTLAEVADMRGVSAGEATIDLLIEDNSRIVSVYKMMSEENVKRQISLPWISFCSDSPTYTNEDVFLESMTHPRAYGSFARLLGKYVRDENVVPLEEAIRKLTSFPAATLNIEERGSLIAGYFADVVVFDLGGIQDHATYAEPHQYATGVAHVFVNGEQVLRNGEHTGALPGRVVRGPGWSRGN